MRVVHVPVPYFKKKRSSIFCCSFYEGARFRAQIAFDYFYFYDFLLRPPVHNPPKQPIVVLQPSTCFLYVFGRKSYSLMMNAVAWMPWLVFWVMDRLRHLVRHIHTLDGHVSILNSLSLSVLMNPANSEDR